MGLFQNIFGGSSSKNKSFIDPTQSPYLGFQYSQAKDLYNQGSLGGVAGFSPYEQMGQQGLANYSMGFNGFFNPVQGALNRALSGQVDLSAYNPIANQITQRMGQSFNENVIPGIRRGNLMASGQPTSRAGIATTQAADRFGQGLGDALSGLYLPAYQNAQNQMMQGLGYAPSVAQLGMMPFQNLMGIGEQQRTLNQSMLDLPFSNLQRYQSLIGVPTILSSGKSSSTPGILGNLNIQGLGSMAAMGGM